jgi:hypothetical protein
MSLSRCSLSSRNCCRERARARHSPMAATIRRITVRGAIWLVSARRNDRLMGGTSGDACRRSSHRAVRDDGRNMPFRLCSIVTEISLNEPRRPALRVPLCSRQLIWQTTDRLLSRNPLRFCSLLPRKRTCGIERHRTGPNQPDIRKAHATWAHVAPGPRSEESVNVLPPARQRRLVREDRSAGLRYTRLGFSPPGPPPNTAPYRGVYAVSGTPGCRLSPRRGIWRS